MPQNTDTNATALAAVQLRNQEASLDRHVNDTISMKVEHARRNAEVLLRSTWLLDANPQADKLNDPSLGEMLKALRKQYLDLLKGSLSIMGDVKNIEAKIK